MNNCAVRTVLSTVLGAGMANNWQHGRSANPPSGRRDAPPHRGTGGRPTQAALCPQLLIIELANPGGCRCRLQGSLLPAWERRR